MYLTSAKAQANKRANPLPPVVGYVMLLVLGCNTGDMHDQPRFDPLEPSDLFADSRSARPLVDGTVARGHLRIDHHFYEGREKGELVTAFPQQVTTQMLRRGQQRFNIFCSACHGQVGFGDGMAVQRGYPRPPSFHTNELRQRPVGHLYDVITNGYGRMLGYKDQVPPADRWAIVAYVRALQKSQYVGRDELTAIEIEAIK